MEQDSTLTRQHLGSVSQSCSADSAANLRALGLTVLAHPSIERVGERCTLPGIQSGQAVMLSRTESTFFVPYQGLSVSAPGARPLEDPYLSRKPVLLQLQKNGAVRLTVPPKVKLRVDGRPVGEGLNVSRLELERGAVLLLADRVALLLHLLNPVPRPNVSRHGLVGESPAMLDVRQDISTAADVETPVLIRGATGTGKELVAQALHRSSKRRRKPFVAVNLGAVAPSLAAAELFGVVRGAFTGADRTRKGYFERAEGGTLFLDEIGEAPVEVQVGLLRALETGCILPVGAEAERRCNVRIVAATDADLESAVGRAEFRAPLLHRLTGFEIHLPTLNARREDIGRLLVHFLRRELEALGETTAIEARGTVDKPWLPAKLVARLARLDWPGNVRQLQNVARCLVVEGQGRGRLKWTPRIDKLTGTVAGESAAPQPPSIEPKGEETASEVASGPKRDCAEDSTLPRQEQGLWLLCLLAPTSWSAVDESMGTEETAALKARLLERRRDLLAEHEGFEMGRVRGRLVLLFKRSLEAVDWALSYRRFMLQLSTEKADAPPCAPMALHLAELTLRHNSKIAVDSGARWMEIVDDDKSARALSSAEQVLARATPGEILLTRSAFDLARQAVSSGARSIQDLQWSRHGMSTPPESDQDLGLGVDIFSVAPLGGDFRQEAGPVLDPVSARSPSPDRCSGDVGEDEMIEALRLHAFNLQSAADFLGLSRSSLYRLMEKSSRVRKARDLSAEEIEGCRADFGHRLDLMAEHLEVSVRALRRRMTELGLG